MHADFSFKHKDSKDIMDGGFGIGLRNFEVDKLYSMADNYLSNLVKNILCQIKKFLICQHPFRLIALTLPCFQFKRIRSF
mgnify:CR=1 FL=1